MKRFMSLVLLFCLWTSPFPSATADSRPDFTQLKSEEELRLVRFFVLSVQNDPESTANHLVVQFGAGPLYGWEADWLTVLKALDLIGYYWSVEKAQFYASAGRWTPPPHPFKNQHLEFYKEALNREAQPYSSGVLNDPFKKFARELLTSLLENKRKAGGDVRVAALIGFLLETKHEFWQKMVAEAVVASPLAATDFVSLLLPKFNSSYYHEVADVILGRSDARDLLRSLMGLIAARGQLNDVNFLPDYMRNKDCAAVLVEIEAEFKAK